MRGSKLESAIGTMAAYSIRLYLEPTDEETRFKIGGRTCCILLLQSLTGKDLKVFRSKDRLKFEDVDQTRTPLTQKLSAVPVLICKVVFVFLGEEIDEAFADFVGCHVISSSMRCGLYGESGQWPVVS